MVSNVPSSRSQILASEWLVFVDALYCIFSFHSLYSSVLEFLFFSFLWILSLDYTSCFVHVLFSWFQWVVYPCSLVCWASFKILILNFFQEFVYFHFCGVSYWKITVFLWWCYVYLIFHVSCSLGWCLHICWNSYLFQIYQLVHPQVGSRVADRWVWWFQTWGRLMVQSQCTEVSVGKDWRNLQQPMLLISVAAVKAARVFSGGGCWSFFPRGMSWPRGFLLILDLLYGCPHGDGGGAVI